MNIGARFTTEAICFILITIAGTLARLPLVITVVEAKPLISNGHAVLTLSIVAKAHASFIRRCLFCDNIDHTANSITAVEHRPTALDNLDAFNTARRNCLKIVFTAPRDWISIHEDKCPAFESAHVEIIAHCSHGRTVGTERLICKPVCHRQNIRRSRCTAVLDILRRNNSRRGRDIHISLLRARRRHNDLTQGVGRHQFIDLCTRMRRLRRINLTRHCRKCNCRCKDFPIPHLRCHPP